MVYIVRPKFTEIKENCTKVSTGQTLTSDTIATLSKPYLTKYKYYQNFSIMFPLDSQHLRMYWNERVLIQPRYVYIQPMFIHSTTKQG